MDATKREELKARIRALPPERAKQLLCNLIAFATEPDPDQPIEEVEAELRAAGYTDEDFARMNKRIDEIIANAKAARTEAQP